MPVTVAKQDQVYRVVESADGSIAKNAAGTAVDGGGHQTLEAARAQAIAINARKAGERR